MNEQLFKLKKNGETVGYLKLAKGWTQFQSLGRNDWYYPCDFAWHTAHPFVTHDKNGKDVFADDFVWYHWRGKKSKAKVVKEDLFNRIVSCDDKSQPFLGLPRTFCKSDRQHIELIEDEEDGKSVDK